MVKKSSQHISIKVISLNSELIRLRDILENMLTCIIPQAYHHLGLIDNVRRAIIAINYNSSLIIEINVKETVRSAPIKKINK